LVNLINHKKIIAETFDEFGKITVLEFTDSMRYLYFGQNMEQSAVLMHEPSFLIYTYNRAMLLFALAHSDPKSALFLGLGAGSLVKAALTFLPLDKAEVIEIRESVVNYAYQYLGFNPDLRLSLNIGDAQKLIDNCTSYDLIFMDLYTVDGPSSANFKQDFIQKCYQKLNHNGWLIINQWSDENDISLANGMLNMMFNGNYWELPVPEGNIIIAITKPYNNFLDKSSFKELLRKQANNLRSALGYSLEPLINKIR